MGTGTQATVFPIPCCSLLTVQLLGETKGLKVLIKEAVIALAWAHSPLGLPSSPFVQVELDDLGRELTKPVKEPEMCKAIAEDASGRAPRRYTPRSNFLVGFLQYDGLSNIWPHDRVYLMIINKHNTF